MKKRENIFADYFFHVFGYIYFTYLYYNCYLYYTFQHA
jgi:hypothetical protein